MKRTFRGAVRDLADAQKSSRGVSLYSRFINRPIGRVLAAAAYVLHMSPNLVTVVSGLVTTAGLVVFVTGHPSFPRAVTVALLLVLGFALDSADGQVARLTGRGSAAGEWLDHVVDAGKIVAVHAAVLIVAYRYFSPPAWSLLVPLLFQIVAVVTFVGGELEVHLKRRAGTAPTPRQPSVIRSIGLLPADYGVLAACFVISGWPLLFGVIYGLLFVANVLIGLLLLRKWFGNLRALA